MIPLAKALEMQTKRQEELYESFTFITDFFRRMWNIIKDPHAFVQSWFEHRKRQGKGTTVKDVKQELDKRIRELEQKSRGMPMEVGESVLEEGLIDALRWVGRKFGSAWQSATSSWLGRHPIGKLAVSIFLSAAGMKLLDVLPISAGLSTGMHVALVLWVLKKVRDVVAPVENIDSVMEYVDLGKAEKRKMDWKQVVREISRA